MYPLKNYLKKEYLIRFLLISLIFNVMFTGGFLNIVTMNYNDNRMPFAGRNNHYYDEDNFHTPIEDVSDVKLLIFCDIIHVNLYGLSGMYSIGDFIICFGGLFGLLSLANLYWFYHKEIKKWKRKNN